VAQDKNALADGTRGGVLSLRLGADPSRPLTLTAGHPQVYTRAPAKLRYYHPYSIGLSMTHSQLCLIVRRVVKLPVTGWADGFYVAQVL